MPTTRRSGIRIVAFRNDEYLWWQVAEYAYDTFMIRIAAKADRRKNVDRFEGPAHKPAPLFLADMAYAPLTTLVEPVQTGFRRRAPSWFRPCPGV